MLVANWHSCKAFFSLLKSQHVARMADIYFSKVPVINKMIFGLILVSSDVLLSGSFSANEVLYFFFGVVDQNGV